MFNLFWGVSHSCAWLLAMLQDDINASSQWIVMDNMQLNLKKSRFSIKSAASIAPPVVVGDTALSVVSK